MLMEKVKITFCGFRVSTNCDSVGAEKRWSSNTALQLPNLSQPSPFPNMGSQNQTEVALVSPFALARLLKHFYLL